MPKASRASGRPRVEQLPSPRRRARSGKKEAVAANDRPRRGVTDKIRQVTRGARVVDDGERVEMPRIRSTQQIHAQGEVDDTFPQRHPSHGAAASIGSAGGAAWSATGY